MKRRILAIAAISCHSASGAVAARQVMGKLRRGFAPHFQSFKSDHASPESGRSELAALHLL
jgi:hypothetical protein